jgi:hypothetical protein
MNDVIYFCCNKCGMRFIETQNCVSNTTHRCIDGVMTKILSPFEVVKFNREKALKIEMGAISDIW